MPITVEKTYKKNGHALRFIEASAPPATHKVVIRRKGDDTFRFKDWLVMPHAVNKDSAAYFFNKHCEQA